MLFLLIFRSQPSGNFLYSSLSILLFGNNGYIDELRVLSSTKLLMYPYYCKQPCFLSLSQVFEKAETHFFTVSIKNSAIDSDLKNEEAVNFQAQTNSKSKEWSSFFVCISPCQCHKKKNIFPCSGLWRWNTKCFEKSSDLPKSRMSFKSSSSCFIL